MSEALDAWRKKLDYLQQQEAIVADPAQKFALAEHIKEAKAKIAELEAPIPGQEPVGPPTFHADISRIIKYAPAELIGRETETKLLNDAWDKIRRADSPRPHVLTFVALGGEGKTSLVAKWAAKLAHRGWPGCDAAFAWSFYSQGTREQLAASSDLFLKEALTFFGDDADKQFAASPAGAFEKGQRLARIVGQRRSVLILDGLEPLQYAPTSPTPGQLKDQGIAALLKGLAAVSHGLCVVTTRYSLPDLKAFWQTTASEVTLLRLSRDGGVHLLKTLGVRGRAQEFETLVEDVKGHALTLTLLGGFLKRAFHGDIRQRDRVKFEKADAQMDGGHAFRTMAAYEQWLLRDGDDEGRREVAVLRLMGLFDRPADAGCLAALRGESIPGLTEPLTGLADDDWEFCLSGLEAAKLLTVNRDAARALVSLDAHPHLRAYFAKQLSEQHPDAWRAAHQRLYEHLCATAPDSTKVHQGNALMRMLGLRVVTEPTLEDLQPLYQAVAHACYSGWHEKAWTEVFSPRILRGTQFYSYQKLGAIGSDLGALACFFDTKWATVSPLTTESTRGRVLNATGLRLRILGRLNEALDAHQEAVKVENQQDPITSLRNLSEVQLELGDVNMAVKNSAKCVSGADAAKDKQQRIIMRTTHGDALHQAGRSHEAKDHFRSAERMLKNPRGFSLLSSLHGFRYCDLLLAAPERLAWQCILEGSDVSRPSSGGKRRAPRNTITSTLSTCCLAVSRRAAKTLKVAEKHFGPLDIALDHLTLGRAVLHKAILEGRNGALRSPRSKQRGDRATDGFEVARRELEAALNYLHRAGSMDEVPRALLTRAWLRFLTGARTGPESAQGDLDEAWEIAERGPMKLFLADIHLHRARLFFREKSYPWKSPQDDLAAAEKLINDCGYHRRDEELADAKKAILS